MVSVSWEVVVNSEVQLPSAVAQCLPAPSLVNSSQIVFFDYVDNSGFLPSSAPWNLSCGLDKSDSESNIESWLIRSGLLFSVELWFWLLVNSVSLVFHADVLPSVCLFTSGSVEFIVYAAAMLFADAFSFVCRDFVGFALSGVALPCWQRCLSPTSDSLDEAPCALFPGCNKGESKRKYQDWIVLFFSHFAFGIPVQVIFRSRAWVVGCGIQVAAAATIAVNIEKVAFPTAAALVYFVGAVAAGREGMLASAAAGIMFAFEGAYTLDEPYTVSAQFLLVSAAAAAFGCMSLCRSAAAGMPKAIVGMFTLESFYQCVVVNDDDTIAGLGSRFASVQLEATPRVDVDETQRAAATSVVNVLNWFFWSAIAAFYFVIVTAVFSLVSAAAQACGCMLSLQSAAASMTTAIVGKFTLGSSFQCLVVNDNVTIVDKGSRFASVQVEASPRVDVDEAPQAEAASEYLFDSSGHVWTEFWGLPGPGHNFQRVEEEGRRGGGKLEKLDSFFVFVVSLEGSSVQVRVEGSDSYESLAAKVAAKVNIPQCHWYLTFSGKDLRHVTLPISMLHRDSTLRMCSRLLGGAPLQPTPGEWFCPACNRGGCWASRRTCFRCLTPRPAGGFTSPQPQLRGRNQRERRALGREPLRSPNQCPTERRPPVQPSGANAQDVRASSPSGNRRQPQPSPNRTDVTSVLELLKGLNLPDDILDIVSNKLTPVPPEPKPEKLLLDMRIKIDSLTKEADRLEGVVRTKTTELHAACQRSADKANELLAAQQEYNELKERIDRPMEETQEPTPPPVPSVSNPADVPVDLDEQGIDMDLNNPGIDEENEDGAGPAVKRKRLSHFDQMMAGLSHFDNESLATFLGHVQAYTEQQTGIAQEAAVVSCG